MTTLQSLSGAQVVLLAARFISDVDVEKLQILASERRDILTNNRIYRLFLSLYPNDEAARSALLALLRSISSNFSNVSNLDEGADISTLSKLTPDLAAKEAQKLLLPNTEPAADLPAGDSLASFVIAWSRHIESTDGTLENVLPLVSEFASADEVLEKWSQRYLVPISRLQYDFYPHQPNVPSLRDIESLSGLSGIHALLSCAEQETLQANIARDLDQVVAPWLDADKGTWDDVNQWILAMSSKNFDLVAKALLDWDGPPVPEKSIRARYAQTGLAVVYLSQSVSAQHIQTCQKILHRMSLAAGVALPPLDSEPEIASAITPTKKISNANFLANALLIEDNSLTQVSVSSVSFLAGVLRTAEILLGWKIAISIPDVARICLSDSEERQRQELRRILQQVPRLTSAQSSWEIIRKRLLWLHTWSSTPMIDTALPSANPSPAFLGRVPLNQIDSEIIDSVLTQGDFDTAKKIYLHTSPLPLPPSRVEERVVSAIYSAYDNASNGNRTRGGMRRAYELLVAFKSSFAESDKLRDVDHLIKATHGLSFYTLTLQHGVPFQPVNIRAHKDPLTLIGLVLEQDARAYTQLDNLLEIGRNLVLAHLKGVSQDVEEAVDDKDDLLMAEQRITYLAITSALAAHDFDTAYSYITRKLLSPTPAPQPHQQDNISWRAVYAAGRYRPNISPKSLHERIASLEKRMDLLSLALTLVPSAEPLSEILGQWRRCDEEVDSLKAQALNEERAFEEKSGEVIPGGFGMEDRERDVAETNQALAKRSAGRSTVSYEEEAPMGLFDVARGAASALRKSAFPLGAGSSGDFKVRATQAGAIRSSATSPVTSEDGSRMRKRDMVSNMVTSGLVSSMGWVLGAQPAGKEHDAAD